MIFSALVKLAALIVLLMLGGIIVSLIISSAEHSKVWLCLLWTKEWDAPNEIFGALVPIYGTRSPLLSRC